MDTSKYTKYNVSITESRPSLKFEWILNFLHRIYGIKIPKKLILFKISYQNESLDMDYLKMNIYF